MLFERKNRVCRLIPLFPINRARQNKIASRFGAPAVEIYRER